MQEMIPRDNECESLKESHYALVAYYVAFIPVFGLLLYSILSVLAIIHIGMGHLGLWRLRKGLVITFFFSILPYVALVYWGGLPSKFYFLITDHGRYDTYDLYDNLQRSDYLWFGKQTRSIGYNNGYPVFDICLSNGKLNGKATYYYKKGKKQRTAFFIDDELYGEDTEWYENGKMRFQTQYYNGDPVGLCSSWYPGGQKLSAGKYVKGMRDGKWNCWYSNGQMKFEIEYKDGYPTNQYTSWYENGQYLLKGFYNKGKPAGRWLSYNEDGTLYKNVDDYQIYVNTKRLFNSKIAYELYDMKNINNDYRLGRTHYSKKNGIVIPPGADVCISPINCYDAEGFSKIICDI